MEKEFKVPGYEDVTAGIVHWPLSVIRIRHKDPERLIDLADHILKKWRNYTDPDAFIFEQTNGEPHNTITPIARRRGEEYELDLTLRNNITTEEKTTRSLSSKTRISSHQEGKYRSYRGYGTCRTSFTP